MNRKFQRNPQTNFYFCCQSPYVFFPSELPSQLFFLSLLPTPSQKTEVPFINNEKTKKPISPQLPFPPLSPISLSFSATPSFFANSPSLVLVLCNLSLSCSLQSSQKVLRRFSGGARLSGDTFVSGSACLSVERAAQRQLSSP